MSYCKKGINVDDIQNNMSLDDIEFTLGSCEQNCNRYYGCDTVAEMCDELKKRRWQ